MPALNHPPALTVNLGERGRVVVTSEAGGRLYGGTTAESLCGLRPRLLTVPDGVERMLRDVSRLCVEAEEAAA